MNGEHNIGNSVSGNVMVVWGARGEKESSGNHFTNYINV